MPRGALIVGKQTAFNRQISKLFQKYFVAFLQRKQVIDAQQRASLFRIGGQGRQRQKKQTRDFIDAPLSEKTLDAYGNLFVSRSAPCASAFRTRSNTDPSFVEKLTL